MAYLIFCFSKRIILWMHVWEGWKERQKFRLFAYLIINPNQERVLKTLGKLLKRSYLN